MTAALRDIERQVLGDIWTSDQLYRNLVHLCDGIGHRFGGSASEHAAAEFLQRTLRQYGAEQVRVEKFPVYSWERGECFFALSAPVERSFAALALPYSGTAELEGPIVDVGAGEAEDFARLGERVQGAIVLTDAESDLPGMERSHRVDKYRRAVEGGAIACVFTNRNPGFLRITGALYARRPGGETVLDYTAPIPGLGISYEAGETIRRAVRLGELRGRIRMRNRLFRSQAYNVVCDIAGDGSTQECIVAGTHYDGHDIAQGATDNGAGTVVALELARTLVPYAGRLPRTLRLVWFACEELGLLGSWHHCDQYDHTGQDETLVFVLNLDGAGRGQGGNEQVTVTGDPALAEYFLRLAQELAYPFTVRDRISPHSDHFPFFLAGYPTATLQSRDAIQGMIGRGWGHTEADTVDKVTCRGLQMGAALAARLLLRLAVEDELPVVRRRPEQVEQVLDAAGLADVLTHHWGRANRVA
jgi:Iap family predicted aminopeptidase